MKAKLISFIVVLILLVLTIWLNRGQNTVPAPSTPNSNVRNVNRNKPSASTNAPTRGFIRKTSYLEYSVHAKCRMKCRHITQEEVKDIMQHGAVNYAKSDLDNGRCPTYALEGNTLQDNQHVRIIFAQCSTNTKVVTCIDLDKDFACSCK